MPPQLSKGALNDALTKLKSCLDRNKHAFSIAASRGVQVVLQVIRIAAEFVPASIVEVFLL